MAWTFIANSENQATLADALQLAADNFDARKGEMYGKIDSMGEHWKGEDYDLFNSSAHNYDNALSDFSDSIRMYSKQFLTISSATEQLAAELVSIIMNMTGSGGAAGGGGTGAGGVGTGGTLSGSPWRNQDSGERSDSHAWHEQCQPYGASQGISPPYTCPHSVLRACGTRSQGAWNLYSGDRNV